MAKGHGFLPLRGHAGTYRLGLTPGVLRDALQADRGARAQQSDVDAAVFGVEDPEPFDTFQVVFAARWEQAPGDGVGQAVGIRVCGEADDRP